MLGDEDRLEDAGGEEALARRRKIDLADEVFVINVGGCIGDSTRSGIEYALNHGKRLS